MSVFIFFLIILNIILLIYIIKSIVLVHTTTDKEFKKYIRTLSRNYFFSIFSILYFIYILTCSIGITLVLKNYVAVIVYLVISLILYIILATRYYTTSVSDSNNNYDKVDKFIDGMVIAIIVYMALIYFLIAGYIGITIKKYENKIPIKGFFGSMFGKILKLLKFIPMMLFITSIFLVISSQLVKMTRKMIPYYL